MTNATRIRRHSAEELLARIGRGEDRTDFARLDTQTEAELERAIAADPDWRDLPPDWHRGAEAVARPKVPVTIRLDADVVDFFRGQGRGWQTRMNAVLRAYAAAVRAPKKTGCPGRTDRGVLTGRGTAVPRPEPPPQSMLSFSRCTICRS
jgi:uncharacterized protein (DUF4415 family)